MEENYVVKNTNGEDLDNQTALQTESYTVFTAFEIFEHLLNPYTILKRKVRQITYFYSAAFVVFSSLSQ
jgi:hypothetical protein